MSNKLSVHLVIASNPKRTWNPHNRIIHLEFSKPSPGFPERLDYTETTTQCFSPHYTVLIVLKDNRRVTRGKSLFQGLQSIAVRLLAEYKFTITKG